jgi:CubicO group peptidase (beta-lactamase class C family)
MVPTMTRPTGERQGQGAHEIVDLDLTSRVDEILSRRPAVGLAVGIVRNGRLEAFTGNGVADIASKTPITEDTVFRIASITKTFTAVAVMQLWEQGLFDLDAPANDYLRGYKLVPARATWPPATVRHLLTHTSGIPEVVHPSGALSPDFGESVRVGERLPSLAEYYRGGLRLVAEPGTRFRYGNHGPATLGQLVEDVSGVPLARYFREHIFEPLGMADTDLVRSDHVRARLATGYILRSAGPKAVEAREFVTAGAASIYSTPRDLTRYAAALVGGGANDHGRVLEPATVASMFQPHYQPDPRILGMGLAFFRIDLGGHRAVEHQGTMPGFDSQLFLAPDDGVGVIAFTNGAHGAPFWLPAEVSSLLRQLLRVPDDTIRTDIPQHPELWGDICGWYWLPGPVSDVRVRAMLGAGAEVFVRDGRLMIRLLSPIPAMYRGSPVYPDDERDPYTFRAAMPGFEVRVVFGQDNQGCTNQLHLDLMPLTLYKRSAARNPRRWLNWSLAALAIGAPVAAVAARRRRATA